MANTYRRKEKMKELGRELDKENNIAIHYACSDMNNEDGDIHAIGITNFRDGASYKIIGETQREILNNLYKHLYDRVGQISNVVIWPRNQNTYGWEHIIEIAKREKIPRNQITFLEKMNIISLTVKLENIFGEGFLEHPRLKQVIELNQIDEKFTLEGKKEIEAWEQGDKGAVITSAVYKSKIVKQIAYKIKEDTIKLSIVKYPFDPQWVFMRATEHWLWALILFFLTYALTKLLDWIVAVVRWWWN